ncbi:MAG: hypothetical protein LBS11_05070 [Oscillospiraceae bacterium]|nr:hypothetical protein [Oscillospiraceae bacterium]
MTDDQPPVSFTITSRVSLTVAPVPPARASASRSELNVLLFTVIVAAM